MGTVVLFNSRKGATEVRYTVEYGSDQGDTGSIESNTRDSIALGMLLVGHASGGWVKVWETGRNVLKAPPISIARYTPVIPHLSNTHKDGGRWYNSQW